MSRVLYFDIDGTVLRLTDGQLKSTLARGALEAAIRRARFDRLVCVGNVLASLHIMQSMNIDVDPHEVVLRLCHDAFVDEAWFRDHVEMVRRPRARGSEIDCSLDWWYMDDLARRYLEAAERLDVLQQHQGGRILIPEPDGDGSDVLTWLDGIGA